MLPPRAPFRERPPNIRQKVESTDLQIVADLERIIDSKMQLVEELDAALNENRSK